MFQIVLGVASTMADVLQYDIVSSYRIACESFDELALALQRWLMAVEDGSCEALGQQVVGYKVLSMRMGRSKYYFFASFYKVLQGIKIMRHRKIKSEELVFIEAGYDDKLRCWKVELNPCVHTGTTMGNQDASGTGSPVMRTATDISNRHIILRIIQYHTG